MLKYFTQLFILFSGLIGFSQTYIPIDTLSEKEIKTFITAYTSRHEMDVEKVKEAFSGEIKRSMIKILNDQFDDFSKDLSKGELYFDKKSQNYLEKLIKNIVDSNPTLKNNEINIHFSRTPNPNAFSVGDGTLVVHLDLLNYLETEGELVSVLCHEISHFTLEHRNTSIKKYVENLTSNETKKEEREINRLKYNKQKRAEKLIQNVVYSRKSKSRIHEFQADSLGYIYFRNTQYNVKHAINSLKNLSKADSERDSLEIKDYRKFFTTKSQKFVEEWLEMEDFSKYHYTKEHLFKWNIDSLKTHPDCAERKKKLEQTEVKPNLNDFEFDGAYFKQLRNIASYEIIANYYYLKEYGFSLYETLKLLKNNQKDPYLIRMTALNLQKLSLAKKTMKLNSYIPTINPNEQTQSQQRFYNFITNLTSNEFERIANDYIELIN